MCAWIFEKKGNHTHIQTQTNKQKEREGEKKKRKKERVIPNVSASSPYEVDFCFHFH